MKAKIDSLLQNSEAVKAINECKSQDEVLKVLNDNGIEVSSVGEFVDNIVSINENLDDAELANVAAGNFCVIIGLGEDANACFFGHGASPCDDKTYGAGAAACAGIGLGLGFNFCGSNEGKTISNH